MKSSREFRSSRLAWRFRKSGDDGRYTMRFEMLNTANRERLLSLGNVHPGEIPAIACYFDDANWALITDNRLRWANRGIRIEVALINIDDATVEKAALLSAGTKQNLTELTIVMRNGDRHHLTIEAGSPFFGFWNCLKMVATWNKRRPNVDK